MFGDKIQMLRQKRNISQTALAKHLSVTPQAVSKWERGKSFPDVNMLVPIADFFGVSVDFLLRD